MSDELKRLLNRHWRELAALAFAALAFARIASTYSVFGYTSDEGIHIITGVEMLDRGAYRIEPMHPPVARLAAAVGPYLKGSRIVAEGNKMRHGRSTVEQDDDDRSRLRAARIGMLPFFALLVLIVWLWTSDTLGKTAALIAVAVLTNIPPVLGHAGIAATDVPHAATSLLFLYLFGKWIDGMTYRRCVGLGLAAGLAVMTKFSALVFLPMAAVGFVMVRGLSHKKWLPVSVGGRLWARIAAILVSFVFVCWAAHGFSLVLVADPNPTEIDWVEDAFEEGSSMREWTLAAIERPLPAPIRRTIVGLSMLVRKNNMGHWGYLLGETSTKGWWYFFPVALAVKTPIALLLLWIAGMARWPRWPGGWMGRAPFVLALTVLGGAMMANINIGLRHIILVYPALAIIVAGAAVSLWRLGKPAPRIGLAIAFAWFAVDTIAAHPDYLADFNEIAGEHPEKILIDSDLDWGQDVKRLAAEVQGRGITEIHTALLGIELLNVDGVREIRARPRSPRPRGWAALSQYRIHVARKTRWLRKGDKPITRVGKSIDLFYLGAKPPSH